MASVVPSVEIFAFSVGRHSEFSTKIFPNPSPRSIRTVTISINGEKLSSRCSRDRACVRVCSRFRDCDKNVRLYGQFSAVVKQDSSLLSSSTSKQSKEEEAKQNYYVNTGYAIRTLREELPELFHRDPSFDIYRDDIVFKDPLNTFIGIENYKSIFWALRFHGRIFFQALWVDIVRVWQPVESVIMVRWTVHGIPRVPWESRGRFDGTSVYKLDKNGKIFEHQVDNIAFNSPPKFQVLAVEELIQTLGCPSTPRPTYIEFSSSPMTSLLAKLTAARYYLADTLTVAGRDKAKPSKRT